MFTAGIHKEDTESVPITKSISSLGRNGKFCLTDDGYEDTETYPNQFEIEFIPEVSYFYCWQCDIHSLSGNVYTVQFPSWKNNDNPKCSGYTIRYNPNNNDLSISVKLGDQRRRQQQLMYQKQQQQQMIQQQHQQQ